MLPNITPDRSERRPPPPPGHESREGNLPGPPPGEEDDDEVDEEIEDDYDDFEDDAQQEFPATEGGFLGAPRDDFASAGAARAAGDSFGAQGGGACAADVVDGGTWACRKCTYRNHPDIPRCEVCDDPKPQTLADTPTQQVGPPPPLPPPRAAPSAKDLPSPQVQQSPQLSDAEPVAAVLSAAEATPSRLTRAPDDFNQGDVVEAHSLNTTAWNGRRAVVLGYDGPHVLVDFGDGPKKVPPANLRKDGPSASPSAGVPALLPPTPDSDMMPVGTYGNTTDFATFTAPGDPLYLEDVDGSGEHAAQPISHGSTGMSAYVPPVDAPPNTPFLPAGAVDVEDAYEQEEAKATTAFQRAALERLRFVDEDEEARFTAEQALELVRYLRDKYEDFKPDCGPSKSLTGLVVDALVWVGICLLLVWGMVSIAAAIARDYHVEASGVLVTSETNAPMVLGAAITFRPLAELQTGGVEALRHVRDCGFFEGEVYHRLRVASLVRTAAGDVQVTAPEQSVLRIQGRLGARNTNVTFSRPFHGEEPVRLHSPKNANAAAGLVGCSFATRALAPLRPLVSSHSET